MGYTLIDDAPPKKGKYTLIDSPDPTGSFGQNVAAGAGKFAYDLARGAGQRLRSVLPDNASNAIGLPTQQDIDEARRLDAPLDASAGGKVGQVLGGMATALIPGANTAVGATAIGAGLGMLQPTASNESALKNAAIGGAAGAAGKYAGDFIANKIGAKFANAGNDAAAKAASNLDRDATLATGRDLGYVVPPSQVEGTGMLPRALEGFSNKINTQQAASIKNQQITNTIAKKALGLPDNVPLNEATLNEVRAEAGKAYQAVEGLKSVNWDREFMHQADGLLRQKAKGVTSNPADDQIASLVEELKSLRSVDGASVIADVKNLREMAKKNFASASRQGGNVGDEALGKAQSKAAELLEDLAERNLRLNGAPEDTIKNFRDARKLIAKSYTVENAISEGAGNVSTQKLASALNRGAPLEGDLLAAAKFGNAFQRAAQSPEKIGSVPMFTLTDLVMGAAGGSVNPALASLATARPIARKIALSDLVQNSIAKPNYGPGVALTLADKAAFNPYLRSMIPAAGAQAGLAYGSQ